MSGNIRAQKKQNLERTNIMIWDPNPDGIFHFIARFFGLA
jgi:hypothetical protein